MRLTKHLMVTAVSCALVLPGIANAQAENQQAPVAEQEHGLIAADLLPHLAELTGKRVISFGGSFMTQRIAIAGKSATKELPLEAIYVAFVANGISTVESGNDIIVGSSEALLSRYSGFPVVGPGSKIDSTNPSALMVKIFSFSDEETAEAAYRYIRDVIDGGIISFDSQRSQLAVLGPAVQCDQIAQMLSASMPQGDSNSPSAAKLLSVSFTGGTVSQYVDTLQQAHPKLSVLVSSDAGSIPLPAIELHDVSARSALMVLSGLSAVGNNQEVIDVMETTPHPSVGGQPVFQIALHDMTMRGRSASTGTRRSNELGLGPSVDWNVWSLRPILTDHLKSADVLKTMREGLAMVSSDGQPAELTYDEKTGLLMAAGTHAQILMVGRMIDNMQ